MNKKPYQLPYYDTNVSIEKTEKLIEKLLQKYNLKGIQTTKVDNYYKLVFVLDKDGFKYPFQFEIIMPEDKQFARQKFRAFYWHLKSRLEVVDFGLFSLQEVFMPELLIKLGDKVTTVKNALKSNQKLLPINQEYFEKE